MLDREAIFRHAYQLQPLPPSCGRLAALAAQDEPDLREVTDIVSLDPVLTARLLRVANSAGSASRRMVGTVKDAVIRLGVGAVLGLTVGSAARGILEQPVPGYGFSAGAFWHHSVTAALAAEAIRNFCAVSQSSLSFTAAMLHDIGKLVLGRFLTLDLTSNCQWLAEEEGLEPFQAEAIVLSLHHGEVGAGIAQYWNLPPDLVAGVAHHHTPEEGTNSICFVTCVANAVARHVEGNSAPTDSQSKSLLTALERLEITRVGFEKLCEITQQSLGEINARFG